MKSLVKDGRCILALLCLLGMAVPSMSFALGMGAAETQSSIGENMRIKVALFNVTSPDGVQIEVENLAGQTSLIRNLSTELDRSNSQLSVLIQSDQPVNEPFFSFSLSVTDATATVSRDFNVLFDLPRGATSNFQTNENYQVDDLEIAPTFSDTNVATSNGAGSSNNSGIMGPYDWAEAGQIPAKFGPVLDGQSLWRVARRINKAMGVSLEQMMWALYQANPQAFSTNSVESLKAGEVLTIPSEAQVRATGFSQAKAQLAELSPDRSDQAASVPASVSNDAIPSDAPIDEFAAASSPPDRSFQLTGVDGAASGGANNGEQSSAIIQSLAETVGNLSQELIIRDEKIAVLEGQVEDLKNFIREEGSESDSSTVLDAGVEIVSDTEFSTGLSNEPAAELSTELEIEEQAGIDEELGVDETLEIDDFIGVDEASGLDETIQIDEQLTSPATSEATIETTNPTLASEPAETEPAIEDEDKANSTRWLLAALALGLLGLLLLRRRIANLFRFLKLGKGDEELDFDHSNEPRVSGPGENAGPRDYSVMQSVQREVDGNEIAEGISYLDLTDSEANGEFEEESELMIEEESDEIDFDDGSYEANEILNIETEDSELSELSELEGFDEINEEDLTFDERFSRLIAEKDFSFARELLDFARYNEINDDRYHCERLRLLKAMGNEDGFYEYYYEIESKIPSFPPKLQTEISQFVVQLAQAG